MQSSENVSLYGLKGVEKVETKGTSSPRHPVAAVYEDESGQSLGHREDSVTSTSLLAKYSGKQTSNYVNSRCY